ncbi:eight-cysteine-cluster domain-containing protein [Candidatus Micrarchaeota archaeon]|nr:eight-cysteine-cluster domain-containing protein [Candidatus Micrarchaeota archaeon]MBD3417928.1 eight-cysteine-cluster domain-containing protein [Candidatus Micrarchaeota archaeon]
MDKNVVYPILSIVLVVIVAAGIYYLADMFGGTQVHHEDGHGEEGEESHGDGHGEGSTEEAEELFFDAIKKPLDYDSYTYAYEETASNGYMDTVFITSSEEYSYVKKEDAIFTREIFLTENRTILCLENVNKKLCINVSQNSTFNPYKYTLSHLLFEEDRIENTIENNEFLIEYGAIVFKPEIHETSYEGQNCSELAYTLDYSKLTVEQMRVIGMDPKSPEALMSKEYNYTICIDPETKDVVHRSLSYLNFGEPESTQSLTIQAVWGESAEVEFPEELDENAQMEEFYYALKMSQENYAKCLVDEDFDSCIRSEAILSRNERLCELINNTEARDGCYLNVALEKGTPELCGYLSEELQADCYIEFAWKYKSVDYCISIDDDEKKQECIDVVTEQEEEPPLEEEEEPGEESEQEDTTECQADSDCVVAGCSSQLCVPKELSDVVTTCEYLEEYECLPLTTCGCYNGTCGWEQNQEYLNCLDEKRS